MDAHFGYRACLVIYLANLICNVKYGVPWQNRLILRPLHSELAVHLTTFEHLNQVILHAQNGLVACLPITTKDMVILN